MVKKGTWVMLRRVALEAGERAPGVPEDTARTPLLMWMTGSLCADALPGDEAEALTRTGRRVRGTLLAENPAFSPDYGPCAPELRLISARARELAARARAGETL